MNQLHMTFRMDSDLCMTSTHLGLMRTPPSSHGPDLGEINKHRICRCGYKNDSTRRIAMEKSSPKVPNFHQFLCNCIFNRNPFIYILLRKSNYASTFGFCDDGVLSESLVVRVPYLFRLELIMWFFYWRNIPDFQLTLHLTGTALLFFNVTSEM